VRFFVSSISKPESKPEEMHTFCFLLAEKTVTKLARNKPHGSSRAAWGWKNSTCSDSLAESVALAANMW
jgi:hypothetical protein